MSGISDLIMIMAQLRNPDGGCPWDLEQNFKTIAPFTIEEAYEVADAIDRGNIHDLQEELGDLLLQVVFHAQMASELGHFTFNDVAQGIAKKLIHRHPHVFGDQKAQSADAVLDIWNARKDQEKTKRESALDDITKALPALMRAQKLSARAAKTGFEWDKPEQVLDKVEEEIAELREAQATLTKAEMTEELGDVLFCLVNYARKHSIDAEEALRLANAKFESRFRGMEQNAKADGKEFSALSLEMQEKYWQKQKIVRK